MSTVVGELGIIICNRTLHGSTTEIQVKNIYMSPLYISCKALPNIFEFRLQFRSRKLYNYTEGKK